MIPLAEELKKLHQLYINLGRELNRALSASDMDSSPALIKSTLDNRSRLGEIEAMNVRIGRLADSWAESRGDLSSECNNEIRDLMTAISAQAVQLQTLCNVRVQKLTSVRDLLGKELAEIEKSTRYLNSMKPAKQNYPKFIDSFY
jgi:hypothetical protein